MPESLTQMWSLIDVQQPLLSADDIGQLLGGDQRSTLESLGFLVPAATATHIICGECHDDHVVEVTRVRAGKTTRFFITCPDAGWCEIDGDRLRQWTTNCEAIAKALKDSLAPAGRRTVIMPGRLWRLGTTTWQQKPRDIVFARGLSWPDACDVARAIEKTTRPIVLVPDQIPDTDFWVRRFPAVVALSQVSQLCDGNLVVEGSDVFAAVKDQDETPQSAAAQIIDEKKLKMIVRQQVKAESKSQLTDDLVVAAYRKHGNVRDAAAALTEDGFSIHPSTVARRIKRAEAAVRTESSESIVRSVASQRRNAKKNIRNRPEAVDWE